MDYEKEYRHLAEVFEVFDGRECRNEDIMCYVEGGNIHASLNCNDIFYWACSDSESIEHGDITLLKKSIEDVQALITDKIDKQCEGFSDGWLLFICRKRKERPQGCCYPKNRDLWPLFDASGPERKTDMGNPYKPGEREEKMAKRKEVQA